MPARRHHLTPFTVAAATLGTITAGVAGTVASWPGLAGAARHALALHPDTATTAPHAGAVLLHNARPLLGLLLAACVATRLGRWRIILDAALVAFTAINATAIGAALGAYGTSAAVHLAHLPLEYAALTLAGSSYLAHRHQPPRPAPLVGAGAGALALLAAGALLEANPP